MSAARPEIAFWPHYFSTPCMHGLHGECKGKCKFCEEKCRCPCHAEKSA